MYPYLNCNKKFYMLRNIILLWVFSDFSLLLVAAMITDDEHGEDDGDMMIAQCLR